MVEVVVAGCGEAHAGDLRSVVADRSDAEEFNIRYVKDAAELEALFDERASIDILIIDVELKGESVADSQYPRGIDLVLRRVPEDGLTQVIYVAERFDWATRVYRTRHVYYLVWPMDADDLNDALDQACENLKAAANRPLVIRSDGRIQAVAPCNIHYIESDRRRLHIHTADGVLTTYATLDSVARGLPSCFVRSHKSFLVNMKSISRMDTDRVILTTGEHVPVSQKRRKATQDAFVAYVGSVTQ